MISLLLHLGAAFAAASCLVTLAILAVYLLIEFVGRSLLR